jgi:hypothetical protein
MTMSEPGSMVPNAHIYALIVASITDDEDGNEDMQLDSRTDLDAHANMFVASKYDYILADSGKTLQLYERSHRSSYRLKLGSSTVPFCMNILTPIRCTSWWHIILYMFLR